MRHRSSKVVLFAGVALCWLTACIAQTQNRAGPQSMACDSLSGADFTGILDAPSELSSVKFVRARNGVPAHCEVRGYVAPTAGFLLLLPAENWNGKFYEAGCGGFCGENLDSSQLEAALRRGYASLRYDSGHSVGSVLDTLWAYNNLQSQFDFGIRAPHVAALAGKAIAEYYYGSAPKRAYFFGCSTGGGQALSEAQRFPWDFDGIISGAPSPTFSGPMMYYLWAARALSGRVTRADLKLVHDAAVAQCDMDDGLKDGIIGDPLHCKFDPSVLLCTGQKSSGCLTAAQVAAVKKVYSGPTTSSGVRTYTGGPLPGSELNWIGRSEKLEGAYVNVSGQAEPWPKDYFSRIGFMPAPGFNWKPADFDFDRDYKRLSLSEAIFGAADNPDLRKFKAAGGKLLMYQGGQDQSDIPTDSVDYYVTAEKTMGGHSKTQDFFRLFLVPGMNHCSLGAGAFAVDYLTYLENWVELRQPPDKLIGFHVKVEDLIDSGDWEGLSKRLDFPLDTATVEFSRPVYPYPVTAKYLGKGNPTDEASFGPSNPVSPTSGDQ